MKKKIQGLSLSVLCFSWLIFLGCQKGTLNTATSSQSTNDNAASGQTPETAPTEPSRTPASPENSELPENQSVADLDLIKDIAITQGQKVDVLYSSNELMKVRGSNQNFAVDQCATEISDRTRFADRISYGVLKRMTPLKIDIGSVRTLFGLSSSTDHDLETSLISHPFCNVDRASFETVFDGHQVPDTKTILKAQNFTQKLNQLRIKVLSGDEEARKNYIALWTKFMMCLGYTESLTSADSKESDQIAKQFSFRRPAGVNLHNDSNQTNANSVLGVGIFQISNVMNEDTYSCAKDWSRQFPACPVSTKTSRTDAIAILGSAYQTFNSYCAPAFVTRMFGVQVNSVKAKNTHPQNVKVNGALVAPADRCVSPFMNVGRSYNHFAPLQNGSGFTLSNLLSCTLSE